MREVFHGIVFDGKSNEVGSKKGVAEIDAITAAPPPMGKHSMSIGTISWLDWREEGKGRVREEVRVKVKKEGMREYGSGSEGIDLAVHGLAGAGGAGFFSRWAGRSMWLALCHARIFSGACGYLLGVNIT
jgi:hypothetical protein